MKCSARWWNAGRYEVECAAFDDEHPLSREVWESLQRHEREQWLHVLRQPMEFIVEPRDSLFLREPQPDPWEEFARRLMREHMKRLAGSPWPRVFDV